MDNNNTNKEPREPQNDDDQIQTNKHETAKINKVIYEETSQPSSSNYLPGEIPLNVISKHGLSKSESNLTCKQGISKPENKIITGADVANALKMTSINYVDISKIPAVPDINFKNVKIPNTEQGVEPKQDTVDDDLDSIDTAMVELKQYLTTCYKTKQKNSLIVPIHNLRTIINDIPEISDSSCVADKQKTFVKKTNGTPLTTLTGNVMEPKVSAISAVGSKLNKKKNSGSLSERSMLSLTQRESLSSIGSNVCRICMTRGRERLISPCNCKGSLANVHLSCLERWLNQVGRNHCELCGYSYPAIRTPRYTVVQALRLWFGNPRNRSHLQSDCLIFWLLSTVTAGLLAVCIVGTQYFVIEGSKFGKMDPLVGRKDEGISHRITETAMDFFMAIVLCGYSVTVYLLWKDHYVMWNRWRRANVNVRLLLTPDSNPVPFVPRDRYIV